jgi:thiol-disulfide isomerase/thioredoxin
MRAWNSTVVIKGESFALTKPMRMTKDITGKIVPNPAAGPNAVDLKLDEFDLAAAGAGVQMKIAAGILPGIYRLSGDRLDITFASESGMRRPKDFDTHSDKVFRVKLVRAPKDFKDFPKQITLRATRADGAPAAGALATWHMYHMSAGQPKDAKPEWKYGSAKKTDAEGKVPVEFLDPVQLVRDVERKQMAFVPMSPAAWVKGEIAVSLKPECRLTGAISCEELTKEGAPLGWTNVYLSHDGSRVASCDSMDGRFEFFVPPGDYTLFAYGQNLLKRVVPISVSEGRADFATEPIAIPASRIKLLEGKPAPELAGIVGWKGTPVTLAELRGKYVLLEFTGHWCGPCMHSMPEMFELHERFKDKGLVIIAVHVDIDGEVDTAEKLDEKMAPHRKNIWKGKDIPFSVALVSGKEVAEGEQRSRGLAAQQYGVTGYPTTILIDREGKVVGPFGARNAKDAADRLEKLLEKK